MLEQILFIIKKDRTALMEDDGHSEEEAAEHTVITITIDYGNSDRVCSWGRSCTGDFNWIYKAVNQAAFN